MEDFNSNVPLLAARKLSPNPPRRAIVVEKDEGISDEEDTAELKLQLELNEQVNLDLSFYQSSNLSF